MVRLSIVNGQRQATIDTGNGPQPALLPGPLPGSFTHYAPPDFDLDLTPEPTEIEKQMLELHRAGASKAKISEAVWGYKSSNKYPEIDAIIAKYQ